MANFNNVIWTKISYRRNIKDMFFVKMLSDAEQAVAVGRSLSEIFGEDFEFKRLKNLDIKDCLKLQEKNIFTKELIENKDISSFGISEKQNKIIYANEEDHIRLECRELGFNLDKCFKNANELDDIVLEKLEMAFDNNLGYLTSNPLKMGTGMELEILLFIPAIVKNGLIEKLEKELLKGEFKFTDINGEPLKKTSYFVRIGNIYTFGYKENEFADKLYRIVERILDLEASEENKIFDLSSSALVDEIFRSFGLAMNAYRMSYDEAITHLGKVLWGINLQVLDCKNKLNILDIFAKIQENHLSFKELNVKEIEKLRAKALRKLLENVLLKGEVDV